MYELELDLVLISKNLFKSIKYINLNKIKSTNFDWAKIKTILANKYQCVSIECLNWLSS